MSDSSIALTKAWRSRRQLFNSLRWPIYVFNSVVTFSTQLLPAILSHRRSTIVSLETYPFIPLPDSLVTNTNIVGKRYLVDQSYPGWPRLCITNVSSPASSWPQGSSLSSNEWSFFFNNLSANQKVGAFESINLEKGFFIFQNERSKNQ